MHKDKKIALEFLTSLVKENKPFVFTKFGDAELVCMYNKRGQCIDHFYSHELAELLGDAYKTLGSKENVYIGDWVYNYKDVKESVDKYYGKFKNPIIFDAILFHENKWLTPELKDFYMAIKNSKRKKVFIGNFGLKDVVDFLNIDVFIPTPFRDAFQQFNVFYRRAKNEKTDNVMYITACGMNAKLLANKLYDENIQFIDCGSALDPLFVGNTRAIEKDNSDLAKKFFDIC